MISGGTGIYQYSWSNGSTDSSISVSEGFYKLVVDDGTGCLIEDSIIITEENPPLTMVGGGGDIYEDSIGLIDFTFIGLHFPWELTYSNGTDQFTQSEIYNPVYTITTESGSYFPVMVTDVYNCISLPEDTVLVNTFNLPDAVVTPEEITIYEGDIISLNVGEYELYEWYNSEDSLLSILSELNVSKAGTYYVFVTDSNNCTDTSENAIVYTVPLTELYVPNSFTPNGDDHNELFEIYALNVYSFNMIITNRWGELIYQTDDIQKFWDGKFEGRLVPEGDYLYFIELLGKDREKFIKQGTINVIY